MLAPFRIVALMLAGSVALVAQVEPTNVKARASRITELSKQLRWDDKQGRDRYLAAKDATTKRALTEVDGFVTESFVGTTATNRVKEELDKLFGHSAGTLERFS